MTKAAGLRRGVALAIGLALALLPLRMHVANGSLDIGATTAAAKDGGKGGGNGGGNEGGNNGGGKGGKGGNKGKGAAVSTRAAPAVGLEVVHRNGIAERIRRGRYEMKDSKGRTIINRAATNADRQRLVQLARPRS